MKTASEYFSKACDDFANRKNKSINIYDESYFVQAIQNAIDDTKKETVFVLFQTDLWKSKRSRVFLGVFTSFDEANQAAKDNDCYTSETSVVIIETNINKFKEQ